jgi:enoyl-CoA hydratase/carnithine racemase
MSEESALLCSDRNGVRTLTLNRPHRKNAINRDLWIALAEALTASGKDSGVRAVVIAGAAGAFCSGADISTPDDSHLVHKLQRLTDVALAQSKALLNEGGSRTLRDALAGEARAQVVNFGTADSAKAYAAFAERRAPSFTGRWALSRSEQKDA